MNWNVYFKYLRVGVGFLGPVFIFLLFALVQFLVTLSDFWVSLWFSDFYYTLRIAVFSIEKYPKGQVKKATKAWDPMVQVMVKLFSFSVISILLTIQVKFIR